MSIEDGMRKTAENLDEAAQAAPTSKAVFGNEAGKDDEDAEKRQQHEEEQTQEAEAALNDSDD